MEKLAGNLPVDGLVVKGEPLVTHDVSKEPHWNTEEFARVKPLPPFKLTPYRLLAIAALFGFSVAKVISAYQGQPVVPTTLELAGVVVLAVAFLWIGLYENAGSPVLSWLHHRDILPEARAWSLRAFLRFSWVFTIVVSVWSVSTLIFSIVNEHKGLRAFFEASAAMIAVGYVYYLTMVVFLYTFSPNDNILGQRHETISRVVSGLWTKIMDYTRVGSYWQLWWVDMLSFAGGMVSALCFGAENIPPFVRYIRDQFEA